MATTMRPLAIDEYRQEVFSDPGRMWELFDGQLREKPGKSWEHLDSVTLLGHLLLRQLDRREYRVFAEGRIRRPAATVFIPDSLVVPAAVGQAFRGRPGTRAIFPDPLPLIVEVWSASTGNFAVDAKLPVYKQRGDQEFWRIHPYDKTVIAWRCQPDGSFVETFYREGAITPESLPGVTIDLAELFDDEIHCP